MGPTEHKCQKRKSCPILNNVLSLAKAYFSANSHSQNSGAERDWKNPALALPGPKETKHMLEVTLLEQHTPSRALLPSRSCHAVEKTTEMLIH